MRFRGSYPLTLSSCWGCVWGERAYTYHHPRHWPTWEESLWTPICIHTHTYIYAYVYAQTQQLRSHLWFYQSHTTKTHNYIYISDTYTSKRLIFYFNFSISQHESTEVSSNIAWSMQLKSTSMQLHTYTQVEFREHESMANLFFLADTLHYFHALSYASLSTYYLSMSIRFKLQAHIQLPQTL